MTGAGAGRPRVTIITLTGMVVGSMVGAGVFSLPRRFATVTGIYAELGRGRGGGHCMTCPIIRDSLE